MKREYRIQYTESRIQNTEYSILCFERTQRFQLINNYSCALCWMLTAGFFYIPWLSRVIGWLTIEAIPTSPKLVGKEDRYLSVLFK